MKTLSTNLTAFLAISLAACSSQADVLFSNFGPNDSFLNTGALVWANSTNGVVEHASQFTVPGAFPWTFDSVEVPFSSSTTNTNQPTIDLWLMEDSGGLPGSIIETMTLGAVTTTPTIYNVLSSQNSTLLPGQNYWIGATPTNVTNLGASWHENPIGQTGGRALRLPNGPFGWLKGGNIARTNPALRINGTAQVPECVIANPSFETLEPTSGGLPSAIDDWRGEFSEIVTGTTLGITPHDGQRMLQFKGTTFVGGDQSQIDSSMFHLVDVGHLKTQIDAGLVEFDFSYFANRVQVDSQTDTRFRADIRSYDGDPADFPTDFLTFTNVAGTDLFTDSNPDTWQPVSTSMTLPVGTDYVAMTLIAIENVFNDTKEEFDGHFADSACVRLKVIPEPASVLLALLGGVALTSLRRGK